MTMRSWKCVWTVCTVGAMFWPQSSTAQEGVAGDWEGVIAGKLRMLLHIEKGADESLRGIIQSLDQGNAKLPFDKITLGAKGAVRIEWTNLGAAFDGTLSKNELTGAWEQGGARVPLTLKRVVSVPAVSKLKPVTRGSVHLEPCVASDGATAALCGTFEVSENRVSRAGRKIALNLMILPSLSEQPDEDPIFGFAGGPGQSATKALPFASFIRTLQSKREIVLIDQRGTGNSNPLTCPFDPRDIQALIGRPDSVAWLTACRSELEKRADLTQYTTSISSDDADEVRAALGYEKVNVVGGSYGSLAALDYLRRHPAHVRAVAIEGIVPPDYRLPLPFAKTIQASLEHLFADCAADPACHKDFPDLKSQFETVVKRLDRKPATFVFKNDAPEQPLRITISRGAFVSSLRTLLYQPSAIGALPYLISRIYQDDWSGFAGIAVATRRALDPEIARGMSYSVLCPESMAFVGEDDIRRATDGTYLGDFDVRLYQKRCAVWPRAKVPKTFLEAVRSDVPALLIAGAEDPATPPTTAIHAAEKLSHSLVVAIPHGTHLTGSACIDRVIAQFIDAESVVGLDTSCVDKIRNPPFLTLEKVQ
jgi:pimeloyl-ACP methyl ester carboxylesterase